MYFNYDLNNKFKDEINCNQKYIQSKLEENSSDVFDLITKKNADLYVCGRKSLADGVFKVLTEILNKNGKNGNQFIESMKVCFYHY